MNNIEKFQCLLQRYVVLMELLNANNENNKEAKNRQKEIIENRTKLIKTSETEEEKSKAKKELDNAQKELQRIKELPLNEENLKNLLTTDSFKRIQNFLNDKTFGDLIKIEDDKIIIQVKSGKGYNGGKIQNYIKGYDQFPPFGSIKLTVNPANGDTQYRNANSNYLHWNLTGQNLVAVWKKVKNSNDIEVDTIIGIKQIKAGAPDNPLKELAISEIFSTNINQKIKEMFNIYRTLSTNLELIEKHKNIVYTGAPGTGKTYLAKEMAAYLTYKKSYNDLTTEEKKHIGFVQFHPSYDYTDFVEGLRPVETQNGTSKEIGFRLTDGIFKQFCKQALGEKDQKYVFIIDEINRGELSKIFGELFYSIDKGYRGKSGAVRTQYANLTTTPNVFDLDLGLVETKDKDNLGHFFIPENVYIIGTMNDIDRSVEPMDFAVRRRFVWLPVLPEERIDMWGKDASGREDKWHDEALMHMNNINRVISLIETLGENYCIGPAYFLEPPLKDDGKIATGDLWQLKLNPLISEYLRVLPKMEAEQYKDLILKAFECKEELRGKSLEEIKKELYPKNAND